MFGFFVSRSCRKLTLAGEEDGRGTTEESGREWERMMNRDGSCIAGKSAPIDNDRDHHVG